MTPSSRDPGRAHGLVGRSPALTALIQRLEQLAPAHAPVLILGETGTGKELVATAVHDLSGRAGRPFEAVNCSTFTSEVLRSELFGHERGAFTGASERRPGLLREAAGGTVFLDEVGELPPPAQAALLRFLGTGEVRAVGATRAVHADVRIVTATHRDLRAEIQAGRFREDLYYRLRRLVLRVPPLRERVEDLPLLVDHIRRQVNGREGLAIEGVTPAALRRLEAHSWPGNVRELEAVLEEGMILKRRGWLEAVDLSLEPLVATGVGRAPRHLPGAAAHKGASRRCLEVALTLARQRGEVTRALVAAEGGTSGESARRALAELTRLGHLHPVGRGPARRYVLR